MRRSFFGQKQAEATRIPRARSLNALRRWKLHAMPIVPARAWLHGMPGIHVDAKHRAVMIERL
ncbi:MAG: hypothetical protein JHC61_04710 [Burkholderiaceae bacterium]|nr:hypothetical protein [Burkholderiaceae bacterium]